MRMTEASVGIVISTRLAKRNGGNQHENKNLHRCSFDSTSCYVCVLSRGINRIRQSECRYVRRQGPGGAFRYYSAFAGLLSPDGGREGG